MLKALLEDYSINEKNSYSGSMVTRESPAEPSSLALDIDTIIIEDTTANLKKLQIGQEINFKIDQFIKLPVYNSKTKDIDERSVEVDGEGSGIITEILDFDNSFEDEEFQELTLKLSKGYAENL